MFALFKKIKNISETKKLVCFDFRRLIAILLLVCFFYCFVRPYSLNKFKHGQFEENTVIILYIDAKLNFLSWDTRLPTSLKTRRDISDIV